MAFNHISTKSGPSVSVLFMNTSDYPSTSATSVRSVC